mmetsp:Transcript_23455/g.26736  ORF Transcript_23455/g.26736 Transcript_23455/m.26736 type:complete len:543 (-) Transcript_23455:125-1753(-)
MTQTKKRPRVDAAPAASENNKRSTPNNHNHHNYGNNAGKTSLVTSTSTPDGDNKARAVSAANRTSTSTSTSTPTNEKPMNIKDQTSLRYISKRVSKKVEEKQTTTYNEVANELVGEASDILDREAVNMTAKERKNHEKNIRRRVYDALNVLLATDIITKTKDKDQREKTIRWKGFPTTANEDLVQLEKERAQAMAEVEQKKQCLAELLIQNVCFRNLDRRNANTKQDNLNNKMATQEQKQQHTIKKEEAEANANEINQENEHKSEDQNPADNSDMHLEMDAQQGRINLPFIVVNTSEKAVIQCEMNREKTDVMFDFNMPFEINDDNEILKRLGLNQTTMEDLKQMLPPEILQYCEQQRLLNNILKPTKPPAPPPTTQTNKNTGKIAGISNNSRTLPPRQQYSLPPHPSSHVHPQHPHPHPMHPHTRPPPQANSVAPPPLGPPLGYNHTHNHSHPPQQLQRQPPPSQPRHMSNYRGGPHQHVHGHPPLPPSSHHHPMPATTHSHPHPQHITSSGMGIGGVAVGSTVVPPPLPPPQSQAPPSTF